MAAIPGGEFDSNGVDPRTSFDALPAGKYQAVIVASEEKETKAGTGSYLQLTLEIVDGEFAKRRVWDRLNLNNPNDQAVSIARATLSAICKAVNVPKLKDSTQLHDLPMTVKVTQRKNDQTGEMGNEIKGYEPAGGPVVTKMPTPPAVGSKPAWAKKSA